MPHKPLAVIFANLKGNIGDFAILHAVLNDLHRRWPGRPLHVMNHTSLTVDEPRYAAFKASGVPDFTLAAPVFSRRISFPLRVLSVAGLWQVIRPSYVRQLDREAGADTERFKDYEAVFVAGGHQWNGYRGIAMLATLRAIHRQNPNIYGYPFSVHHGAVRLNPRDSLKADLGLIRAPLVVRDTTSQSLLSSLGLEAVLGSDCVYSLHEIGAAQQPAPERDARRPLLVLTATSGKSGKQALGAIARLKASYPGLALMTTCISEDGPMYEKIARDTGVSVLAPLTWQEAVAEMKASSIVISNRLHGLILASFADVPVLPFTDRSKVAAFARDTAVPHAIGSLERLNPDMLAAIISDRASILDALRRFKAENDTRHFAPVLPPMHEAATGLIP